MTTGNPFTPVPPAYQADERDTEHAIGHDGPITTTTQVASTMGTDAANTGGSPTWVREGGHVVSEYDSSGINGQTYDPAPVTTSTVSEYDTTVFSAGATPFPARAYRAPLGPAPGAVVDTTRTGLHPGGSATLPDNSTIPGSILDTANIGAPGYGGPQPGTAVPDRMAAPTVQPGPNYVTVSWVAPADPAGDKVRGYTVVSSTGGTEYAQRGQTALDFSTLVADVDYTFQIFAISRAGSGPLSPASAVVQAYNPEEPDKAKPAGIAPGNTVNPIYRPDGTAIGGMSLTPASETLSLAGTTTQQLTAVVGTTDVTASSTFTSSDEAVATVSAVGLVTAVAAGSATVSATYDGLSGSTAVTVTA